MQAEFLFDFASPNVYLAHKLVPGIEHGTGVSFLYTPVLLGGIFKTANNKSPFVMYADIPNKLNYEHLEFTRFIKKHALPFQMNPHFPVNTLLLMRIATGAWLDSAGELPAFLDAAMHHMWLEPKKLDDPAILRSALIESGLDAERLLARAQEQRVKDALLKNTQDAVTRGAFGLPTFFVDGEIYFGKDRLRDVEEAIVQAKSRG